MLPRLLHRAARQAAAGGEPLGSAPQLLSCGPGAAPLAQLTSLLGWQRQQAAGYAAPHRGDAEEEEEELAAAAHSGRPHRHSKLSHSERRQLIERKLAAAAAEEEREELAVEEALEEEAGALMDDLKSRTPVSYARRQQIRRLLSSLGRDARDDSAAAFVTRCEGRCMPCVQGAHWWCWSGAAVSAAPAGRAACLLLRLLLLHLLLHPACCCTRPALLWGAAGREPAQLHRGAMQRRLRLPRRPRPSAASLASGSRPTMRVWPRRRASPCGRSRL